MGFYLHYNGLVDSIWERRIHAPFVLAALGIALTTGFGYAALLVGALALNVPTGLWWLAWSQAHGHAQLFGFVGLFVLGMGLYFLPRLRGARLRNPARAERGFWLLTLGILGRTLAQPVLATLDQATVMALFWRLAWAASAVAEAAGIVALGSIVVATLRAAPPLARGAPAWPVLPFIWISLASFGLAILSTFLGTLIPAVGSQVLVPASWNGLTIEFMLSGVALPMAFAFSVRNLPLFLRLAMPPRDPWRWLALVYAVALLLRLLPDLTAAAGLELPGLAQTAALGGVLQALIILAFIWVLDLAHRRPAWLTERAVQPRPEVEAARPPTRPGYPDAGEYGRFELLVYSAYLWLLVFVAMMLLGNSAVLLGYASPIPTDVERHTLTLGFVTLLVLGMAARMVPGFSGKKGVPRPGLVMATFILGNLAVLMRVVPLFFGHAGLWLILFGLSGVAGWLAVAALALNLYPILTETG